MTSPLTLSGPYPYAGAATVDEALAAYARVAPDDVLVLDHERSVTARQARVLADRLGRSLAAAGVRQGEAVGLLMANGWRWVVAYLALVANGYIAVPLNTWYKSTELRAAREKTHLRAVVSQRTLHGRDNGALLAEAGLLHADGDYLGTFRWDGDYPDGLDPEAAETPGARAPEPGDVAVYAFTSGSSAEPKVVVLHNDGLVENGWAMGQRMGVVHGDPVWFAAPLFFGLGCANVVFVTLTHGLRLCVEERFEAARSAQFIEAHGCTVLYGLGPMLRGLAAPELLAKHDLSSFTKGVIGVTAEDKRVAVEELGVTGARSVYGMTECYGLATMTEQGDDVEAIIATQGRPVDGHELRIVDPVTGTDVPPGDPDSFGEIVLRGRTTPGYLDNPDANAQAFTANGWFRTGDLGWLDDAGRLHFAGRLKEVVKINGITISPAEVEGYLAEHTGVAEAYAFGWPDRVTGEEALWCAVVLGGDASLSADTADEQLRAWLKARISSYKVPRHVVVIADGQVPLTSTGKVNKRLIGEQFIDGPRKEQP